MRRCLVRAMYLSASAVSYLRRYIKCSTFTFTSTLKRRYAAQMTCIPYVLLLSVTPKRIICMPLALLKTLNFLRHGIAAACVLKMPFNHNHLSSLSSRKWKDIFEICTFLESHWNFVILFPHCHHLLSHRIGE